MAYWDSVGKSDEWYTPAYIFEALGCRFDLDVASPQDYRTAVPADQFISYDSLQTEWNGFVWMNPPFGGRNGLTPWLDKFFAHGNGIALTPDRTSAPWFRAAWSSADVVLFTPKIKFMRPDGTSGGSPSNGTALMAAGEKGRSALHRAARTGLGILAVPLEEQEAV
ncbi:DNA N-6-adenine-methyltransferase [Pararhizobium qamdonense]|uniref:DNA N-6-adenine-methyltransferase n=1 Tax=Pararhizobium qamdonense TaxID=3031126 RepID=UPI0023E255BA|nr:DNA N-6-adenine-methyltransferase [Pararhizobium qamdonense]